MLERAELKKLLIDWIENCVFDICPMINIDIKGLPNKIENELEMIQIIKEHL